MPNDTDLRASDWDKIYVAPTGCWLWTGATRKGYGYVKRGQRTYIAHRYVWLRLRGPVPDGLELDHLCRVTRCVNPDHLEPVSHRENVLRGESPGALALHAGRCAQGHQFDTVVRRGKRVGLGCSVCIAARSRRYAQRKRAA